MESQWSESGSSFSIAGDDMLGDETLGDEMLGEARVNGIKLNEKLQDLHLLLCIDCCSLLN